MCSLLPDIFKVAKYMSLPCFYGVFNRLLFSLMPSVDESYLHYQTIKESGLFFFLTGYDFNYLTCLDIFLRLCSLIWGACLLSLDVINLFVFERYYILDSDAVSVRQKFSEVAEEHSASIFRASITSVNFYMTSRRNIPEDITFHIHRFENLRYTCICLRWKNYC
jgi:hypothetical protein